MEPLLSESHPHAVNGSKGSSPMWTMTLATRGSHYQTHGGHELIPARCDATHVMRMAQLLFSHHILPLSLQVRVRIMGSASLVAGLGGFGGVCGNWPAAQLCIMTRSISSLAHTDRKEPLRAWVSCAKPTNPGPHFGERRIRWLGPWLGLSSLAKDLGFGLLQAIAELEGVHTQRRCFVEFFLQLGIWTFERGSVSIAFINMSQSDMQTDKLFVSHPLHLDWLAQARSCSGTSSQESITLGLAVAVVCRVRSGFGFGARQAFQAPSNLSIVGAIPDHLQTPARCLHTITEKGNQLFCAQLSCRGLWDVTT